MKKKVAALLLTAVFIGGANFVEAGGIGIGIGIPYGGVTERAGYSKAENYAVFSVGKIVYELTVTEKHGRLAAELKLTNDGDEDYTVENSSGQTFEMEIVDKNGDALWRYSDGMAFTQAVTTTVYKGHGATAYKAEIERKEYRKLKENGVLFVAYIANTPNKIAVRLPDAQISNRPGGTIIIGGGTW